MFATWRRRLLAGLGALALATSLAACESNNLRPAGGGGGRVVVGPGDVPPVAGGPARRDPAPPYDPPTTIPGGAGAGANAPLGVVPPIIPSSGGGAAAIKVALLLPLSGQAAELGRGLQQAAELAVFDFGDNAFQLSVFDTESGGAAAAADKALAGGAQLILGPVFAKATAEVASRAASQGVPVVSFSSDRAVAGNNVFIMGLPPGQPILRALSYARGQGITRVAALLPEEPLGQAVEQALRTAAASGQIEVGEILTYPAQTHDASAQVQRLSGHRGRPVARGGRAVSAPAVDFQAVVLADAGLRMRMVATLFPYYDLDPPRVRMIGLPLWEDPGLLAESAFNGAWFAAPDPEARARFARKFEQTYRKAPPRIATLAYDAVGMAAVLARTAGRVGPGEITTPQGFAGADGLFRFGPDGVIERGLAILEVQPRGLLKIIAPAPTSFQAVN